MRAYLRLCEDYTTALLMTAIVLLLRLKNRGRDSEWVIRD